MTFFADEPDAPRSRSSRMGSGRARALVITAIVLVVLFILFSSFTGIYTDRLWFKSLGYGEVFSKMLITKAVLFVVFGVLFGGFVVANIVIAYRYQPVFRPAGSDQDNLARYRDAVFPLRRYLVIALGIVLGIFAGSGASGEWRQFQLWWHRQSFGTKDPYFHKDVGFFVFDLPWLHYVVNVALTASVLALVAAALVHYLVGGIRLQSRGDRISGAAQAQLSALLGLFVLVKAVDYWLDRFDLTIDQGRRFTGVNFTADHAQLPAKNILMFIAIICAVLFFANVIRRTWMLPTIGLGLLVLSAILLGALWPGIVWQFQVKPSEPDKEAPYLSHNITATRDAYGLKDVESQQFDAKVNVTQEQQDQDAASLPGIRLIDPQLVNQTFEQLQQVRGYYSVAQVLDVDRYNVDGETRDVVLGVRELDQDGLAASARNWANDHTVYTHGYGVIAAFGNNRDADGKPVPLAQADQPAWADDGLTDQSLLAGGGDYEHRIYFGEKSSTYSIVGKSSGGNDVEVNDPASSESSKTTYDGKDGVSLGNIVNKAMYALKFGEPNILLSGRVNSNSKILYERSPRERVEKVAPWLTVDNDPYPAIVDGHVVWILDGYTMTDRYPNAQRESLEEMTRDTLRPTTSFVTLPTDQINYVRNSVKATVDAYDGTVTLYQWDEDPILDAWKDVFPDIVKPKSAISDALMAHLRYPEDMFKVQRYILAQYHIDDPQAFYNNTYRWEVPFDPSDTTETSFQPPYRLSVQLPQDDGSGSGLPEFSITSVYLPYNRKNLASFISVDSDATSADYGKIRILTLPDGSTVDGPSLIANKFASDESIQQTLQPIKLNQTVLSGNLLTQPVGGGLLYVQPVYAQQTRTEGAYPVLRYVLATFGDRAGIGRTLEEALVNIREQEGESPGETTTPPPTEETPPTTEPPATGGDDVLSILEQIDTLRTQGDAALRNGDLVGYAQIQAQIDTLIQQALAAARQELG